MIDGALARLLVQKHARLTKHFVGTAAQDSFFAPRFSEARAGYFRRYAKVRRQAPHVSRRYLNAIVNRAAVRDALIAIVILWFLTGDWC